MLLECIEFKQAEDQDLDNAGKVFYSMVGAEPFSINSSTGEINTKLALDYEKQQVTTNLCI